METETMETEQNRAEVFANRMIEILNHSALVLMVSVGHRTGLFDTMASLPPSTSGQIAGAAGLNERYVREWLGALVTGRIVEYETEGATYQLPPEHAAFLTRAAAPNNLAVPAQFIPLLGAVEDQVVESFRHGGGVPYAAYPRFHEVMAEESGQTVLSALIESILPLAPGLPAKLAAGIEVLDVGCGRGRALLRMAETYPASRFTGSDLSPEATAEAAAEARRRGLPNVRFVAQDAATIAETERFGLITAFDAIHDQAQPTIVLRNIARALRPDGIFLMQDIGGSSHVQQNIEHPLGPLSYTISCMHCMTVSLAAGGEGLGAMWGVEKAREMLAAAGFTSITSSQLPHDIQNVYFVARKDGEG